MERDLPSGVSESGTERFWTLALLAAAGVCHLALMWEAWGWPAIDGYPTIERFLDPNFLSSDFYTNTSRGYGVDTAQSYLFGGLERATGVRYDVALALLNAVRCLTFPALVYAFFFALSRQRAIALSGVLLAVFSNFALPKTLGWAWVWGDPSTAMFAIPAVVLSWTFLLHRRAWACFLSLAFAAAMHPLASLHGCIVVGTIVLFDYSPGERRALFRSPRHLAGMAVFGAVFVAQYLLLKADPRDELPISEYVNIMAYERHPGDFLPSRFPLPTALAFLVAALVVLLILRRLWDDIPRRRLVTATLAVYALVCLSGWLFVEIHPIRVFVQLIPFRTANVGAPFMIFVLACFAGHVLKRQRYTTYGALLVLAFAASSYAARFFGARGSLLTMGAPLLLLLLVTLTLRADGSPARWESLLAPVVAGSRLLQTTAAAFLLLALVGGYARRGEFVVPRQSNQHPVYAWMAATTPSGATFLVDQFSSDVRFGRAITPQKVRLVGRRAVVASLDFPFLDRDMRAWYARWHEVLVGRTPDRVDAADLGTLAALRKRFPFEYVLRRTALPEVPGVELAESFESWRGGPRIFVYRLKL